MNPLYPPVAHRASHRCEYCHAPQAGFNFELEVEHITPKSRGGTDKDENLALACRSCNLFKPMSTTGFDDIAQSKTRLFNPRLDRWQDHFDIDIETCIIRGTTKIGRATVKQLRMNRNIQIAARESWVSMDLFP